jgi:hypothetical protein
MSLRALVRMMIPRCGSMLAATNATATSLTRWWATRRFAFLHQDCVADCVKRCS